MTATRWGIVSTGMICNDFVNAMQTLPESEHKVVAVAARSMESAEKFKAKFCVERAYEGYQSLAKDPEVDVVYIGNIVTGHLEVSKMMLDGGKHVLCEKPLCVNLKQVEELVDYARSKKVFFMEAIWSRCLPSYKAVRECIAAGKIGDVKNVVVTFGQHLENLRLNNREMGGGATLDLGIYCVQLIQMVMGQDKPEKVLASGYQSSGGVDLGSSATLVYSGGRSAIMSCSIDVQLPNEAHIIGTKGSIKVCSPMWTAIQIETPDGKQSWELPKGSKYSYGCLYSENFVYEAQHVRDCIQKGLTESPLISLDETLTIAQILQEIRTAAGTIYNEDK